MQTQPVWSLLQIPHNGAAPIFWGLVGLWVVTELFVGRHGLDAASLNSDKGSSILVIISAALGFYAAFGAARLRFTPLAPWAVWAGITLMLLGLGLRVVSILWLGPMFTRVVQIIPAHRLVTGGPYRFVRHPSYSGLLLFFAGAGAALGDWLSIAAMLLLPATGITYRIIVEERALLAAFGDEYRAYAKRVARLVPFLL